MLDCGGKRCGYAESESSSGCDDSESSDEASSEEEESLQEKYQREAELKRRARARLIAERARNGVVVSANASKASMVFGLPATPRQPPQSQKPLTKPVAAPSGGIAERRSRR